MGAETPKPEMGREMSNKEVRQQKRKERKAKRFSASATISSIFGAIAGIRKTDGLSPIALVGRGGKREIPGFTPNEAYNTNKTTDWYGNLLDSHPDYKGKNKADKDLSTEDRFNLSKDFCIDLYSPSIILNSLSNNLYLPPKAVVS